MEEAFAKAVFFGRKFAEMSEYDSAQEHYAKADALKPDQPAVLYNLAVVLARAGRYSDAQVKVDRYLQLFPEGEEKANVAKLQLELEFQRELQKKRQADQEYADLFNRAKFTYTRGELDEALKMFRRAEQVRPNDPASVYNQAVVLEKQGQLTQAIERYRRYAELESDLDVKAGIDERVFTLQREVDDRRTKIVCSFCGRKLDAGAMWCERCWHGPYPVRSAVWGSRPCVEGASATRATYFSDQRFNRNDILPCLWNDGSMLESLRYSAARQRAIQEARKTEGWTYQGDVLQGNPEVQYHQGAEYLEKVTSTTGGEILTYLAHSAGSWLLDREDLVVDASRFVNQYTYDASGRIAQQRVDYQNTAACNHLISMTADAMYDGDALASVSIKGGYEGFVPEGAPKTEWQANVAYTYDDRGRLTNEELTVTSLMKTYMQKPLGSLRDEIGRLYAGMRVKRPVESVQRIGDVCAPSGATLLSNPIDLRPFYALTPNLAMQLPNGVTKAVVTFTYPP
ncbi:MAG: tetratricopeptide repeat protein [Thermoanaerobaculia bacterium]